MQRKITKIKNLPIFFYSNRPFNSTTFCRWYPVGAYIHKLTDLLQIQHFVKRDIIKGKLKIYKIYTNLIHSSKCENIFYGFSKPFVKIKVTRTYWYTMGNEYYTYIISIEYKKVKLI